MAETESPDADYTTIITVGRGLAVAAYVTYHPESDDYQVSRYHSRREATAQAITRAQQWAAEHKIECRLPN